MKTSIAPAVCLMTTSLAGALTAGEPPAPAPAPLPKPAPSAGLVNDWMRSHWSWASRLDVGGQVRARVEDKKYFATPGQPGADDFVTDGNPDNTYLLLREKVHVGYTPVDWLTVFGEMRDSSSHGDDRNPNPEADSIDLHQGYLALGNYQEFPLGAKVGRQELSYGDERLVGAFDWNNIGRVFDTAILRLRETDISLDAFGGRVVLANDGEFNVVNDYDWFWGLYASTRTLVPKQETQAYFFGRNTSTGSPTATDGSPQAGGPPPRDIYTLGVRVKSLPGEYGPWDYDAEIAGQLGRFKYTVGGPSLDQAAWAAHLGAGYTFQDTFGTPRVGLAYNYATGDDDPTDNQHGTFDNLFPTNHKFYGYMDFVSWQNIHNVRLTGSLKPVKGVTVTLDYHNFWLADTSDAWYRVNGAPRGTANPAGTGIATNPAGYGANPNYENYLGSEIDLVVTYRYQGWGIVQAGYGHFFRGPYIKSSLANAGGSSDANYLYLQGTLNF